MAYTPEAINVDRELGKIADAFAEQSKAIHVHADALLAMSKRIEVLENPAPVPPPPSSDLIWRWDADTIAPFGIHAKDPSRVTLVTAGGRRAVRLLTLPGDNNVNGSNDAERCDLRLSNDLSDAKEGREWWFTHGVWFPDDFVDQPVSTSSMWNWGVVLNFHDDSDIPGTQQPLQLLMMPRMGSIAGLHVQIYGGVGGVKQGDFPVAPIVRNLWYDFVYHIRWSATSAGFADGWVNGRQFMSHKGPTLHAGHGAYLKLANYHSAHGKASAVLHGPIVRARTAAGLA